MNNERFVKSIGPKLLSNGWLIDVDIYAFNSNEDIVDDIILEIISNFYSKIPTFFTDEFEYMDRGFCQVHFGRRGITVTTWYYGFWGDTFEVFASSWYTYERKMTDFELLSHGEPICSNYELSQLSKRLKTIQTIIKSCSSKMEIINKLST